MEALSGYSLDAVRVHYDSAKPAQLQARAYTQGTDIFVGPGQEQHLSHEAWHVVQQAQGRVKATMQMKDFALNDDAALEREADLMGRKALITTASPVMQPSGAGANVEKENAHSVHPAKTIEHHLSAPVQRLTFPDALKYHRLNDVGKYEFRPKRGSLYPAGAADLLVATKVEPQASMLEALKYAADRFEAIAKLGRDILCKVATAAVPNPSPNGNLSSRNGSTCEAFVYEITIPFGAESARRNLTLKYQFCNGNQGYIIHQEVTGEGPSRMNNHWANPRVQGYTPTYFSTHASTGKEAISGLIEQGSKFTQSENERRLDARTKLAGEGARFNVVKNNMGIISDVSKIYTIGSKGVVYWVDFHSLWGSWVDVFGGKYGITDAEIAEKLKAEANFDGQVKLDTLGKFPLTSSDIRVMASS